MLHNNAAAEEGELDLIICFAEKRRSPACWSVRIERTSLGVINSRVCASGICQRHYVDERVGVPILDQVGELIETRVREGIAQAVPDLPIQVSSQFFMSRPRAYHYGHRCL